MRFIRSSKCANGTCVEVADAGDQILVRDGKNPGGPMISFDREQWADLLDAASAGQLISN